MEINKLTGIVVDLCIKIHSRVGPGCLERVYEILYYELSKQGIDVKRQLMLPIDYEGLHIDNAYKLDLLVENKLVIELKSVHPLPPIFFSQLQTQLSLLNLKYGMLINFKVPLVKDGSTACLIIAVRRNWRAVDLLTLFLFFSFHLLVLSLRLQIVLHVEICSRCYPSL